MFVQIDKIPFGSRIVFGYGNCHIQIKHPTVSIENGKGSLEHHEPLSNVSFPSIVEIGNMDTYKWDIEVLIVKDISLHEFNLLSRPSDVQLIRFRCKNKHFYHGDVALYLESYNKKRKPLVLHIDDFQIDKATMRF